MTATQVGVNFTVHTAPNGYVVMFDREIRGLEFTKEEAHYLAMCLLGVEKTPPFLESKKDVIATD